MEARVYAILYGSRVTYMQSVYETMPVYGNLWFVVYASLICSLSMCMPTHYRHTVVRRLRVTYMQSVDVYAYASPTYSGLSSTHH